MKMTRDGNEQESSTHAHAGAKLTASVSGNIPVAGGPWAAKASITAEARTNKGPSGTIAVNATRNVDMAKFMDPEDLTENFIDSVCGSVSVIASLVKNKGLPGGVSAGQLLGQMSKSSIASSVAGGAASKALTDKLGDIASASMKQALDISLKWSGGEATLTAQLAKSSKLKIAQDIRAAKLDVTIENLTRMCRLSKSFTTLRRSPTV